MRLASYDSDRPISVSELAQDEDIPAPFLEQIFADFKRAGLVSSSRGAKGGYSLQRPSEEINAGEVLSALDGPLVVANCLNEDHEMCARGSSCSTKGVWQRLYDAISNTLESITVAELSQATGRNQRAQAEEGLKR